MLTSFLGLWPAVTPAFGGEDPVKGEEWHHAAMTWAAARDAGWAVGGVDARHDTSSPAAALAWHCDYVDSYLYNPLFWAAGGLPRFQAALFHHDELVKLHFDDLTSTAQIKRVWTRYQAGTVAGLLWAADNDDVEAARNIVGAGLHAQQDFYSHSNWMDDPQRRMRTWFSAGRATAGAADPRDAMHLFTGAYEGADHLAFKPHGKFAFDLAVMRLLPGWLLDLAASPASPLANSDMMRRWREGKRAVPVNIPQVAGVAVPPGLMLVDPPGIALDSTWMTAVALRVRDLPDRDRLVAKDFFYLTRDLAQEHTTTWLRELSKIMTAARHGDFWERVTRQRVSANPASPARQAVPDTAETAQYEQQWRAPFGFLTAGAYPPDPQGKDEGWFLRLELRTADEALAGTDADIYADVDGSSFLLDHMHERKSVGPVDGGRLLEFNDFEAGQRGSYVVGPFAQMPKSLRLRNDSASLLDVVGAAWRDLCGFVTGLGSALRDIGLSAIAGHADYVGTAYHAWSWDELVSIADAGGQAQVTLTVDGKGEGCYAMAGVIRVVRQASDLAVAFSLTSMRCVHESKWDRGSDSDEPLILLAVSSPGNGDIRSIRLGPFGDVDSGEVRALAHQPLTVTVPRYAGVVVPCQVWESDDEGESDRRHLEADFVAGYHKKTENARSQLLDAIGRALNPDWKLSTIDVVGFRRDVEVSYVRAVRQRKVDAWVKGDGQLTVAFDTVSPTKVALGALAALPVGSAIRLPGEDRQPAPAHLDIRHQGDREEPMSGEDTITDPGRQRQI